MTTDREALLPCPFCGGRAEIQRGAYTKYVLCLKCAVMGPNLAADDELIAAWNRRAALSAHGGEQTAEVEVIDPYVMDLVRKHGHAMTNSEIVQRFLPKRKLATVDTVSGKLCKSCAEKAAQIAAQSISQYSGNEACAVYVSNKIIAAAKEGK